MLRLALTVAAVLGLVAMPATAMAEPVAVPDLVMVTPDDQSTVTGPVTQVALLFKGEVDLVVLSLVTPDQNKVVLYDAMVKDESRRDFTFTFGLPAPQTMPGTYLIEYSVSITAPDGSASATSDYRSFTIADASVNDSADDSVGNAESD
jgi:methionine-rich copper-binding protein CopC